MFGDTGKHDGYHVTCNDGMVFDMQACHIGQWALGAVDDRVVTAFNEFDGYSQGIAEIGKGCCRHPYRAILAANTKP